ncbi:hypothetical protein PLESTB_000904500 [Pleodorina starrii]|uniref:Uncharacterized protein n=1 Tax=Pleodorina starrii TaxID=330485 RepID=A0A9W6BMG0_9CHLO|nr:hypothetical protein PLESTM_001515900 [Pleodorina starrii]GLC54774.1 hypothetical protein PLESTB_000904500 [Pleodorina starrii]GLC68378.1 hypothetical protein PLESTF_000684600 [Pleodorina starrii]
MLANLRGRVVEGRSSVACNRPLAAPARISSAHRGSARRRGQAVVVRAESDYYELLGVPRTADKKTIKQAYRQKARKYHPDVNKEPGAEDLFKKIGEAYEVLSDDTKKAIYDKYGEAGLKGGMGGMGGGPGVEFSNPFDLFESFFGMGGMGGMSGMGGMGGFSRGKNRAQPGEDDRVDLQLDFLEAVFGCARELDVDRLTGCEECDTTGVRKGTTPSTCPACQGSGQVVQAVRTPLGTFQQVSLCGRCEGTGQTFTPCPKCQGDGRVRETKRISLKVPAGVDAGSRLRVRGEGNSGRRGGEPGDLYVNITIKDHPELRRDGMTIHSDVEISYVDAILGTQAKVATVDGPVELKIPAGTQPGTTLLMSRRGVPKLGAPSVRGDHMVHVRVRIPKTVTAEERKLVEELKELQSKTKVGPFRF